LAPAILILTVGATSLTVANKDPTTPSAPSIYGCHGRILLEDIGLNRNH
jgi:hypothetical protein